MSAPEQGADSFGDPIHRYSRREAIEDGTLVDVTGEASPAEMHGGFVVPVAITASLHHAIGAIPDRLAGVASARGRLHDVMWMAACAAKRAGLPKSADRCSFCLHLPVDGQRQQLQELVVHIGPGDAGEPVVTIGYPEDF